MNINKLIDRIKPFEPKLFFEWLSVISLHPSNQMNLLRFELIMSAFLSIEKEEFLDQKASRVDISNFFQEINQDFESLFLQIEDYSPFDQNKLIPLFINGSKYYFSYGLIENPYTRVKVLANIITDLDNGLTNELDDLKKQFIQSLEVQTNILSEITKDAENKEKSDNIYIPSQEYLDKHLKHLEIKGKYKQNICQIGCLNQSQNTLLEKCMNFQTPYLFPSPFVIIENANYIILPHFHIEYFGYKLKSIVNNQNNYKQLWAEIDQNTKKRLDKICLDFFSSNSRVYAIFVDKDSEENLLVKYNISSCYLIDQNKLLFFNALNHKENKDYANSNETYKIAQQKSINLRQEILEKDEIGFGQYPYNHIFGIKSKDLEIWNILISENISLEMDSIFLDKNGINEHFTEIGDLAFLFDRFFEFRNNAPLHFIKFLQNDRDFMNSPNQIMTTNYLDRVAMYLSGDNYYFKFGKNPDFLNIVPYQGNEFESDYYFNKFKDEIYEIVEKKFPDTFNVIEHIENSTYRAVDVSSMSIFYIVKIPKYSICIYPPLEINALPNVDAEFLTSMLPQLFCFYIDKLRNEFVQILRETKIYPSEYSLFITSNSALEQKENQIPFLKPIANQINNNPFIIKTERMQNGSVRSFIIANTLNTDILINLFKPENNSAEKYCIRELLSSIHSYGRIPDFKTTASELVDKYIPDAKKSFSFNLFETENPKLDKYGSVIKINSSDIGKVNKLFAEHLFASGIKPGVYTGEKSKEINGTIFDFLQSLLEGQIKNFNSHILVYSYQQLELVEGEREMNKIKHGMNTNRAIRYNLKEKVEEETKPLILQSAYSKHIIQTILKINPNGEQKITKSDWTFLLGIVAALMETSQIYEYINYDLSPHKLIISDLYEITTEKISDKINHEKYQDELINHQIESSKHVYKRASESHHEIVQSKEEISEDDLSLVMKQFDDLNLKYKNEYGYYLRNQLDILYALSRSNFESKYSFPLSMVTLKEIVDYLISILPKIDESEIVKVLEDNTLSYQTYKIEERLIPTELLRSKNRLNVCPIVKIENDQYLFGNQICKFSHLLWWDEILGGDFPYQVKNKKINSELDKIHKINSKQLEIHAANNLKTILDPDYVLLNLKKFNTISSELPKFPPCGEIDILCISESSKTLFVLEAKSILQKNRPYSINQVFKDFYGVKGKKYNIKLNKKHDFVKENIEKFVTYFKLEYNLEWKVKKAFVVDKNVFAAYHTEYDTDFVLLENLEKYITE